jgi:hypothetical protein
MYNLHIILCIIRIIHRYLIYHRCIILYNPIIIIIKYNFVVITGHTVNFNKSVI